MSNNYLNWMYKTHGSSAARRGVFEAGLNKIVFIHRNHNNNNNSYIALYPVKIYKLAALYIKIR